LSSSEHNAVQICGEVEVRVHIFLNSTAVRSKSDKLQLLAVYPPWNGPYRRMDKQPGRARDWSERHNKQTFVPEKNRSSVT